MACPEQTLNLLNQPINRGPVGGETEAYKASVRLLTHVRRVRKKSAILETHHLSYLSASKGVCLSAPTTGVLYGGDLKVSSNSFFMGKAHQAFVLVKEKHRVGHFSCVSEENTNPPRAWFSVFTKEFSASWPLVFAYNNTGKLFATELGGTNLVWWKGSEFWNERNGVHFPTLSKTSCEDLQVD